MDIALDAEINRVASRFLAKQFPVRPAAERPTDALLRGAWSGLLELGWQHILATDGKDPLKAASSLMALFQAIGENPLIGPVVDAFVAAPILYELADERGQGVLGPVMEGRWVVAMARWAETSGQGVSSDPWFGSDLAIGRLNGVKTLVETPTIADAFLVFGKEANEPSIVLVDADDAGMEIIHLETPDRSQRPAIVEFRNVKYTPLFTGQAALRADATIRILAQVAVIAELTGMARVSLNMAVEYAKVRRQFGRTIGGFQAIKHILAEARVYLHGMESIVARLGRTLAEGATVEDASSDARRGLCFATRAAQSILDASLQVHGGIGFTLECNLSWYYNRVNSRWSAWGAPDELAIHLGRAGLARMAAPKPRE
jgi:alkylation response protein AidB-like acyl-CoA dehydrogenase